MAVAAKSSVLSVEDVNKTLESTLQSVFESERFHDLLHVMSSMKDYSLNNKLLIVAQNPRAKMVMGFKDWQKLGRFVEKGEKGLKILAPVTGKRDIEKLDPQTKEPIKDNKGEIVTESKSIIKGFRPVSVFDVSQTDGKEIPSVRDFIAREMENDEYMATLYHDYKKYLTEELSIDIKEAKTETGVGGYFHPATDKIVISSNNNANDTEKFRVLIHEYAHHQLHGQESLLSQIPRGHKEAQAESVAYVVSNYYGLDSTAVSAGYIATWSKDMKLAKQALNEIQNVANGIIDDVNRLQKEKVQNFYQDQSQDYEEAKTYLIENIGISKDAFEPNQQKETSLQLINTENGYILSGKLEYNPKNENFFLRTNRNLIEPLAEISRDGKLRVLNVEKELDQVKSITEYSRIPDHYEVKKVRNGPYLVQSSNGRNIISKGFEKKEDAKEFQMRASISQSLHQDTSMKRLMNTSELKKELQQVSGEIEAQINRAVGDYLSHHSHKNIAIQGQSSITVGWTLLKNPTIKTTEQLKRFSDEHKHVPTYTKLPEALNQMKESEQEIKKGRTATNQKASDNGMELARQR